MMVMNKELKEQNITERVCNGRAGRSSVSVCVSLCVSALLWLVMMVMNKELKEQKGLATVNVMNLRHTEHASSHLSCKNLAFLRSLAVLY